MLATLNMVPWEDVRGRLFAALRAMDTKGGALALTGRRIPVSWLSPAGAEELLQRWKNSRVRFQRDLAGVILPLAVSELYGHERSEWDRIGYPGPPGSPPDEPKKLKPEEVAGDETIRCDVVVVGSGAGGGAVAGLLAEAGLDVVVLEKGPYRNEADFKQFEPEAFHDMYLYGGILTTEDLGIRILSGCTVGGGTTINWSTSWKTPRPVLEEWARVSGIDAFVDGEIEASLDAVADRLHVNTDESTPSRRDALLEDGLRKLGWHVDAMPRNVRACSQDEECGFCCWGCKRGAKLSSMRTYLEDAAENGARIYTGADVRKVSIVDGAARGVVARMAGHQLTVEARAVVVACGTIETPALLLRSGLGGRVGHNLRLHPGTAVVGVFDDEVRMWGGVMQARYSNELGAAWSGGYGATLESGPFHPGGWSTAVPWTSAMDHRARMGDYAHMSQVAVLSRDTASGRVTIDKQGVPKPRYKISPSDERRIAEGVIAAGMVLEAAGAREIFSLQKRFISYRPSPGAHERWADETRREGFREGKVTFASMHQMGTCAMGTDPTTSAIGPDNESHEVRNLFVADGSTFPTPCGVNPMLSIYGIAHRAAGKISARLS